MRVFFVSLTIAIHVSITAVLSIAVVRFPEPVMRPLPEKSYASASLITPSPTAIPIPSVTPTSIQPSPTLIPTATVMPTATPTATVILVTGPELEALFTRIAGEYSVDKEQLKRIALCESGFNTNAQNGPYGGMYQFSESSWQTARAAMSASSDGGLRYHPEEAIKTAAFLLSQGKAALWPNC